ncbi:RICIN domain-containing protein [Streptomyces sp. SID13666]|nr:RICIN domain-containing protein [Streptomyces sp. SID13666]NEA70210.1 RICIN domain-containing protein [Streptomyces sp. SID13588]
MEPGRDPGLRRDHHPDPHPHADRLHAGQPPQRQGHPRTRRLHLHRYGADPVQPHGGTNQQWTLTDAGGGYVKIMSLRSGKLLGVAGDSTADLGGRRAAERHRKHEPAVAADRR